MTENYYPEIPETALWAVELVLANAKADPEYLEDAPYTPEDMEALGRLIQLLEIEIEEDVEDDTAAGTDKWVKLERETKRLFDGLMQEQKSLSSKDNAEKMSFFRTATSLLDKLVGIQERAANLKQIHMFHDAVLTVMEDVLDAGQRTQVMDRLKAAINPEKTQ